MSQVQFKKELYLMPRKIIGSGVEQQCQSYLVVAVEQADAFGTTWESFAR